MRTRSQRVSLRTLSLMNLPTDYQTSVLHIDVVISFDSEDLVFCKPLLVPGTVVLFDDLNAFPGGSMAGERRLSRISRTKRGYSG